MLKLLYWQCIYLETYLYLPIIAPHHHIIVFIFYLLQALLKNNWKRCKENQLLKKLLYVKHILKTGTTLSAALLTTAESIKHGV